MSTGYVPYAEYKASGVGWLDNVPAHWSVVPGKACYREKKVSNVGLKETTVLSLSYGQIVIKPIDKLHGLVPASFETYQIVEPSDIIVRPTDLQNDWNSLRFGFSHHRGIITSAYMCLRTQGVMSPEYGHFLLQTYDLMKIFYGLGSGLRQNLDWRDFKYLPCLVPPLEEQNAIVHFLNDADRRIQRYIRTKQKLIKLLEEQKQAIIHQAMTRGLDPNVRLKPSGIPWLPEVPITWSITRLGNLAESLQTGPFGSQLHAQDYIEGGIPVINPSHMLHGRIIADNKCAISSEKMMQLSRHRLEAGDIIFARRGELGRCALVTSNEAGWLCGTGSLRMRVNKELVNTEYLLQLLLSNAIHEWLSLESVGSTMENLNTSILARLPLSIPPVNEQMKIHGYITRQQELFNSLLFLTKQEISLVREYRTRLIADVVTGKLDVRAAAAQLPDEAGDAAEPAIDADVPEAADNSMELADDAGAENDV